MARKVKVVRFEMTLSEELDQAVMEWRRSQPDLPNRNEALRRLILMGLERDKKKDE